MDDKLREKIARTLWEADRGDAPQMQVPFIPKLGLGVDINTVHYGYIASLVVELIHKAGYVKLAEDQEYKNERLYKARQATFECDDIRTERLGRSNTDPMEADYHLVNKVMSVINGMKQDGWRRVIL